MARILVVDDRPADREFLQLLLGYVGHSVVTAGDGEEGLRIAYDRRPDLAIVDIVMPTMDGLEFVSRLRADPKLASVPIIFYTASFLKAEAEKLPRGGHFHRVLQKPAEPEDILKAVSDALGLATTQEEIPPVESPDRALLDVTLNKTKRELEAISQRLAVLVGLAHEFATASDPDRLLERLGYAARSVVGSRYSVVAMMDEDRARLARMFTIGGGAAGYANPPFPSLDEGVFADLLQAKKAVRRNDLNHRAREFGISVDTERVTAYLAVPIVVTGTTIGFLCLLNKVGGGEFTEDEERVAQTLSAQAAITYENIRLMRETERRLDFVNALRAIDVAITGSLEIRLTLDVILDKVVTHLHVDAASILLYNRGTNLLETTASRGFRTQAAAVRAIRFGDGHPGTAVVERRIFGFGDAAVLGDEAAGAPAVSGERFAAYFVAPLISKGRVLGVLEVFNRTQVTVSPEWTGFLEALAGQAAIAIDEAELFSDLQRANLNLVQAYDSTLEGWVHAVDLRDKETFGHTERVTAVTLALARASGFTETDLVHVRRGALLHDIGKLGIPDAILLKPGPLTEAEWIVMKMHPTFAFEWLRPINYLRAALDIPYGHHEKWDGSGYPRRLAGEQIPLAARLFAVVDVWDALSSERPYREAWSREKVFGHLRSIAGSHLAPTAVDEFFKLPEFADPALS